MRRLTLQILQKTIREVILRTLAPGVLLALRSAVRTGVFHRILLRIAVQSGPARAAYTYSFITPVHGIALLGIHVHMGCDAPTPHFGTVSQKYSIYRHFERFSRKITVIQGNNPLLKPIPTETVPRLFPGIAKPYDRRSFRRPAAGGTEAGRKLSSITHLWNFSTPSVSNELRNARTSHPCERGAGFLKI
jgi:hypothetical protein